MLQLLIYILFILHNIIVHIHITYNITLYLLIIHIYIYFITYDIIILYIDIIPNDYLVCIISIYS